MRVKDLKPNTYYATADGACVKTAETVERGWCRMVDKDGKTTIENRVPDGVVKPDPWKQQSSARPKGGRRQVMASDGIRVTHFLAGRDGTPIEKTGVETVINPREIKGTWEQYLELHGGTVKMNAILLEARQALDKETGEMRKKLRSYGLDEKDVRVQAWSEFINSDKSVTRYLKPSRDVVDFKTRFSFYLQSETAADQYLALLEKGTTR